mmetsp:Transcript_24736/g.57151  ORF Transcript_24736/g.57151 Transcript_24736/m.57151 type:complete len:238 (-) Transcript_24736:678-1391(-)
MHAGEVAQLGWDRSFEPVVFHIQVSVELFEVSDLTRQLSRYPHYSVALVAHVAHVQVGHLGEQPKFGWDEAGDVGVSDIGIRSRPANGRKARVGHVALPPTHGADRVPRGHVESVDAAGCCGQAARESLDLGGYIRAQPTRNEREVGGGRSEPPELRRDRAAQTLTIETDCRDQGQCPYLRRQRPCVPVITICLEHVSLGHGQRRGQWPGYVHVAVALGRRRALPFAQVIGESVDHF